VFDVLRVQFLLGVMVTTGFSALGVSFHSVNALFWGLDCGIGFGCACYTHGEQFGGFVNICIDISSFVHYPALHLGNCTSLTITSP